MSKFLGQLLEAQEPMFTHGMMRLEKSTGMGGVDLRLIADVIERAHKVMRKLGLDPKDTTGHELYASLRSYVKHNDACGDLLDEMDYVMLILDGVIISFNMIDIIENIHHGLEYKRGIYSHGQRSLKGEIINRYTSHVSTDNVTTLEIADSIGLLSTSGVV
jgi:hypothetical protein